VALGGDGVAHLAWAVVPGSEQVRIVRGDGGYPQGPEGGTVVYEGDETTFADERPNGVWYYSAFGVRGGAFSNRRDFGTDGTPVGASGQPAFFEPGGLGLSRLTVRDPDGNGTFAASERAGGLDVNLAADAVNGERDWMEMELDGRLSDRFTIQWTLKTPSRLNQSWSLLTEAFGSGNLWTAFNADTFRVSLPGAGWRTLSSGLAADTEYVLTFVVDGVSGSISYYVDGELTDVFVDDLREMDRFRVENYGYASADLDFGLSAFSVRPGVPDFHVIPNPETPVAGIAVGDVDRVYLAWVPEPTSRSVRVVRRADRMPGNADDGDVVYEGIAGLHRDEDLPAGTYHYAIFPTLDGSRFGEPFQLPAIQVGQAPAILGGGSAGLDRLSFRDGDYDGTFRPVWDDGWLVATLDADAVRGELDHLALEFRESFNGRFSMEVTLRTGDRLDQSWNAVVEAAGSRDQRIAVEFDQLRAYDASTGWQTMARLAPDTAYRLGVVFDLEAAMASYYLDEALLGRFPTDLRRMNQVRLRNYGYGERDQTVSFRDVRVSTELPDYHTDPPLEPVVRTVALGGDGQALLAWTAPVGLDLVRVVRRDDRYPATADDGDVVYEGVDASFADPVAPGTWYYTAFTRIGGNYGVPARFGETGTVVAASGTARNFDETSIGLDRLLLLDPDRTGSFAATPTDDGLVIELPGDAPNNERDGVEMRLAQSLTERISVEFGLTPPGRLDQSWSLVIELAGGNNLWMAVRNETLYFLEPGGGWRTVIERLTPAEQMNVGLMYDTALRQLSVYVDEVLTDRFTASLTRLDTIRFRNYGYAERDLTYVLDGIDVANAWPDYVEEPALEPPLEAIAMPSADGVALAWIAPSGQRLVRVVRRAGAWPANGQDGEVVYEGEQAFATDAVDAGGPWRYSAFAVYGENRFSPGVQMTAEAGVGPNPDGRPAFFAEGSVGVARAFFVDGDKDGTFQVTPSGDGLELALAGEASDGERDRLDIELARTLTDAFHIEYTVTMPARVDQSWGLLVEPAGRGNLWLAFIEDDLRMSIPGQGWQTIAEGLQPAQRVQVGLVVEGESGQVTAYIDENLVGSFTDDLSRLDRIRIQNYGYAAEDLTYGLTGLAARPGYPDYHQPPALTAPVNAFASGGSGGVALAWTPAPGAANVRVVRNGAGVPEDAADGDVVYSGTDQTFFDDGAAAGTWYYAVFAESDGEFSAGRSIGANGVTVSADGTPAFGTGAGSIVAGVRINDGDANAGARAEETADGALALTLAGAAESGERDYVELELDRSGSGPVYTMSYSLTTPDRLDQDWNLLLETRGRGNIFTAFRFAQWRVNVALRWPPAEHDLRDPSGRGARSRDRVLLPGPAVPRDARR
jgi:hypothetical protein